MKIPHPHEEIYYVEWADEMVTIETVKRGLIAIRFGPTGHPILTHSALKAYFVGEFEYIGDV